jgi:aspartyl-tRNA(Asn)/glutamyl-tRNA(Gln) amidotransferase subunit A
VTGDDLVFLGATAQAALVRAKQLSPVELVQAYLARVDRLDGELRAYVTLRREAALADARAAESAVMRGEALGPLHGVPFAVKDQFTVRGVPTTVGSRLFADAVAQDDATVVRRLRDAGGVLLGTLNLTEFALGGTFDFPFGQPRNPWNRAHDPGGSSAGSGVAVAAALCAVALGEDTGGSVRSPASYCGTVGLRPTWGRVSRCGSFPLSPSMDAAGPLSRTVEDSALVLRLIAGRDERDPTTSARPVPDYPALLGGDLRGTTVGLIRELTSGAETDDETREAVTRAAAALVALGARVEEVSLPLLPLAGAVFMALADSEGAGLHLPWLRSRPRDYDRATRRRLLTAGILPASVVHQAERARALLRDQVHEALARHDLLICPTSPRPAPTIAQLRAPIGSKAEVAGRFFGRRSYTTPASLAGVPALAVPCGFSRAGLPLSLQIIGRAYDEAAVLRAGHAYEQATDGHRRRPPV